MLSGAFQVTRRIRSYLKSNLTRLFKAKYVVQNVQPLEINRKYFRPRKKNQDRFCWKLGWTGFRNFSKIQRFQLFIRISFQVIGELFPYRILSEAWLVHYLEVSFFEFSAGTLWYRGVPRQNVSFCHWLTHIKVQHLVLGSTTLKCNIWSRVESY